MRKEAFKTGWAALVLVFSLLSVLNGAARSGENAQKNIPPDDALLLGSMELGGEHKQFTGEELFIGTAKGKFSPIIRTGYSLPAGNGQVFGVKKGESSISVTLLKGTSVKFEENPFFHRLAVYGVPSEPGEAGLIAVYLYVGTDGSVMTWARNHRTKGRLQVRLIDETAASE